MRSSVSVLLLSYVTAVTSALQHNASLRDETILGHPSWEFLDQWRKLYLTSKLFAESALSDVEPLLVKVSREVKLSNKCLQDITRTFSGIREMKEWALKMVDSNGKLPSGILSGTFQDPGDYDGCLSVSHPEKRFVGQYCSVHLRPYLPKIPIGRLTHKSKLYNFSSFVQNDSGFKIISDRAVYFYRLMFSQGICTPSTCTRREIEKILSVGYRESGLKSSVPYCEVLDKPEFETSHIIVISVLKIILAVVVISTVAEIYYKRTNANNVPKMWTHFSVCTNFKDFVDVGQGNRLSMLNGLKIITMVWLTLVHTYLFTPTFISAGMIGLEDIVEKYYFQIVANSWLSVEVYLLISGLLMSYSALKSLDKEEGKINYVQLTIKRILRLWPAMWAVLGMLLMIPYVYSGPLWQDLVVKEANMCNNRWWTAMFFLNSWMYYDDACLVHMWYVSADLQLYVISLILISMIYRNPKLIFSVCLPLTIAGCVITGLTTYMYDLQPSIIYESPSEQHAKKTISLTYFRPWTHVGTYIVGVLLGYLLHKNKEFPLKPAVVMGGWLTAFTVFMSVLFAPYNWHRGYFPSRELGAFYQATQKLIFALPICWTIFACYYGHGGAFNRMLSWKGFVPLGKLSYLIYLSQMPLIWLRNGSRRQRFHFTHFNQIYEFFGNFALSVGVALVLYLIVEQPFASMQNLLFPTTARKPEQKKTK